MLFRSKVKVAKVNKKGKVTGVKKGSAKITVTERWKVKKKNKTRKVGVVKVKVTKDVFANTPTNTPIQATANATQVPPTNVPNVTQTPAIQSPIPTTGPTMEPAYGTYVFDTIEDQVVELGSLIRYGAVCKVKATVEQKSGSNKALNVSYYGTQFNSSNQEVDYRGAGATVSIASGDAQTYECEFSIITYMTDCKIEFVMEDNTPFTISNIEIATQPFAGANYQDMVDESFIQLGNTERLKRVIDKARAGEDVTLAFIGGSITEGHATVSKDLACYAETSYLSFKKAFGAGDGSNVHYINAGMSGTPSSLGVIRYQNDVLNEMKYGKYPDVLCIEFVVNDSQECTNGVGMESMIRQALEQGSAVFLMFAHTVNFETGKQDYYMPLGQLYDLPMVSVKNGLANVIDKSNPKGCDATKWFFSNDTLHPNISGHRYMADVFMNVFHQADEAEWISDPITNIDNIDPKYGKSFTGMTMLDSTVDPNEVEAILSLDAGDFGDVDTAQNKFVYEKGGKLNVPWFPNCWMHKSGDESFKARVNCSNMMIAYKLTSNSEYGTAELYVDGVLKETMTAYDTSGWNNASVRVVFDDDDIAEHDIEIRMAKGNENKKFTIYAIGYTNTDDYKSSLEK